MSKVKIWVKLPKIVKVMLSIVGAIFLSALGTPFWNQILKPLILFLIDAIFNIFTHFCKYIELEIFSEIANISLFSALLDIKLMLFTLILMPSAILLGVISGDYIIRKMRKNEIENKEKQEEIRKKNKKRLNIITSIYVIFLVIYVSIILAQNIYVMQKRLAYDDKIIELHQYVDDHEIHVLNAKFKKIKCKQDYNDIMEQVDCLLKSNNANN